MSTQKTWFITGISNGLGKSIATYVMTQGDFVIGTFRKAEQVEAFNQANKGKGIAYQLDIRNFEQIDQVVASIAATFGRIDVLVNNAGVGFIGAVEETSIEEARSIFEINVFGVLKVTQAVLPIMRTQHSGHIFQMSSHGGVKAFAGFGIYNSSKFALEGFSEALAQEVSPLGIHVTIVEPGPFRTGFASSALQEASVVFKDYDETAGAFRARLKGVDGKQEGDPDKAAAAIFNTSREAQPPLRMPLGKVACMTIGSKLESVKNDLERGRAVAEGAVFPTST